jgi:hypothetical protein
MRILQKFAAAHASVCNHFHQERALNRKDNFKLTRAAALAEWADEPCRFRGLYRNPPSSTVGGRIWGSLFDRFQ